MAITYQKFLEYRNRDPQEYEQKILPKMDLLEAALRETAKTLSKAQPKDARRIADFNAMADAIHTVCHPGTFTRENTKISSMEKFGTLAEFLEGDNGRNFDLMEATMQAHPELRAKLPQAEQSKPMMELYNDLGSYFTLGYYQYYMRRVNRAHRERFLANRYKNLNAFQDYTAKQIRFVSEIFRRMAKKLEDEDRLYQERVTLRTAADHLDLFSADEIKDPQALDYPLERLRELSALLEQNGGELAHMMHGIVAADPKLLELLPNAPALRKMPALQHLMEVFQALSLDVSKDLREFAFTENLLVTGEQDRLAWEQEEAARLADQKAEEEDAKEALRFQTLEANMRKEAEDRRRQEEERQANFLQKQEDFRKQNGPFALPPEYSDLDAAGMLLHSVKQNGAQYQALVSFGKALDDAVKQWDDYFEPGKVFDQRLAAEMEKLPENAPEEVRGPAVEEALNAVSPAEQEKFLRDRLFGDYQARLADEQARLGPDATPEQARASLYREELTESLRAPLREAAHSRETIEKSRADAALDLAAQKRNDMDPAARDAYEKDRAQIRNDVIARRIRNKLMEAGQKDDNFRAAFLADQMPTVQDQEQYLLAHSKEPDLVNNYHSEDYEKRHIALYNSRLNELLNEALYDRAKWNELNQLFEKLGVPQTMEGADPKKLLEHVLETVQDDTLDAEADHDALEKLSKTIPDWEIERSARRRLPLGKSDQELLYGWAREQKRDQVRSQVEEERKQALPELAALGIDRARAMRRDLNKILPACSFVLPVEAENAPLQFSYAQALADDNKLDVDTRRNLQAAYERNLAAQQNGGQLQAEQPDPKLSEVDKRAVRARIREQKHWQRVARIDVVERRQAAEEQRRKAFEDDKDRKALEQYVTVGASLARLRAELQSAKLTQGELGKAYQDLDKAWTQGDLQKGKELKETLRFDAKPVNERKEQLADDDIQFFGYRPGEQPRNAPAPGQGVEQEAQEPQAPQENGENVVQRKYTEVDDDILFNPLNGGVGEEELQEAPKAPKLYVFQPEYVDAEKQQQDELRQRMEEDLNQGAQPVEPPPVKAVVLEGNVTAEKARKAIEQIQANPKLRNARIDVPLSDPVPGFIPNQDEEPVVPPQNAANNDVHSASWWIKKLRSPESLYVRNPKTNAKVLDPTKIAYIMAARELASSVRHEKDNLLRQNLTLPQIKARALALAKQPEFSTFIHKVSADPNLRQQAISAAGTGHGGGLDDMFTKYLAQKAPGELPTHPDLKRWAPSALQRIEGLQDQLRNGNLDEFQSKKRLAEIIAARKLTGARHAGKFQHADENLNKKLDPKVLNAKTEELEVCLHMLAGAEYEELRSKATDGHGGAMMERFKELNTVAAQKQRVQQGMTTAQLAKVDAATIMATYAEPAASRDLQLEDANAMKVAAELRKRGSYQAFIKQNNGEFVRQNAGELYASFVGFHNNYEAQKDPGQPVNNLIEALDENIERQDTMDILRVNDQELMNQAHN